MSLILDALRRSESERAADGGVPGISTQQQPAVGSNARFGSWLLIMLAAVLLVTLAALVLWLNKDSKPQQQPAVAVVPKTLQFSDSRAETSKPAMAALAGAGVPAASPTTPLETTPEALPVVSSSVPETVVETATRASLPQQAEPDVITIAPINTPLAATTSRAAVAELYRNSRPPQREADQTSPSAPASRSSKGIDIEAMTALAARELATQQLQSAVPESEVELLGELAQSFKDQVPSLYYRQHSWSAQSRQRFVVINGENRREGDRVAAGVTLLEILQESSVLEYQGTQFRLRALNSWVNL
ncbi:general secretion pathway protein GspB [Candidatus Litorirhabdus singularis]|nr:general secretion pathway protein GspB [Candidatus Litorirhabdus singularis]